MAGAPIDAVAASITTVGQARAALGKASELFGQAYGRLADLPSSVFSADDVEGSARLLLDQDNGYAQRVYAALPSDDASQGNALDPTTQKQVQAVLQQADGALRAVEDAAGVQYWDFSEALRIVTTTVGQTAGQVAGAAAGTAGKAAGGLLGGLFSGLGLVWSVVVIAVLVVVFVPGAVPALIRKVVPR